jgi:uncharacterized repeat protein (TIGR03806 family)
LNVVLLSKRCSVVVPLVLAWCLVARAQSVIESFDPTAYVPCTSSRVSGTPDPPLPFTTQPWRPEVSLPRCLYAAAEPGRPSLLVVLQGEGDQPARVVRVMTEASNHETQTVLEVSNRIIYSIAFHPDYHENGWLFVGSNGPADQPEKKNRVSRFAIGPDGIADMSSEKVILEWRSMGHDGCALTFGLDRMLYITSGDGTSDSDTWLSAQDVTNLLGSVLRIDVDHPSGERPYSIPPDNPFLTIEGARPELWAIGLRNPWRMCTDRKTGHIWVGNNGQDLWETAHLLRRGENYGWSVFEGSHPFYANRQLGPATYVPPTLEHHHREARSLTGGEVYYGDRLKELNGAYVYGDYSTGKIWGARHDGEKLLWHQEIADTAHAIVGFAVTHDGTMLVVDYGKGLHELIPNPPDADPPIFPQNLKDTGLFLSVAEHRVAPGVIPYEVNSPGWSDGASAMRFLALPPGGMIGFDETRAWQLPEGTVLLQTLSVPIAGGATRHIETRMLHRYRNEWNGYAYLWNDQQDEATLVSAEGCDIEVLSTDDDRAPVSRAWRVPSRSECMSCHARAADYVLGVTQPQLNREVRYHGGVEENQVAVFSDHLKLFSNPPAKLAKDMPQMANPYDASQPVDQRARAYLHTNCSVCHVMSGGGNARMELEFTKALPDMKIIDAHPQHDTLGIFDARIVAPGAPERSIMVHRMARRGRGQMPPLVSHAVDEVAVDLFRQWIAAMPPSRPFVRDWQQNDVNMEVAQRIDQASAERGKRVYLEAGCGECHRILEEGGGVGPDLTGLMQRRTREQIIEALIDPSKEIAPEFALTVFHLADGRVVEGRIRQETPEALVVQSTGSFAEPVEIAVRDIEERTLSRQSIMPRGLLNTWDAEAIVDLVRYLIEPKMP